MAKYTYRERCACGAEFEQSSVFGTFDQLERWRARHEMACPRMAVPIPILHAELSDGEKVEEV